MARLPTASFAHTGELRMSKSAAMAFSAHNEALAIRHADLEQRIFDEEHRPQPDSMAIAQLKKAKLRIKEELSFH
jgi:hypothetical protein